MKTKSAVSIFCKAQCILIFLLMASSAGAQNMLTTENKTYEFNHSSMTVEPQYSEWTVVKGTEAIALMDFLGSGKLCSIIGHRWAIKETHFDPNQIKTDYWCVICHKPRKFDKDLMDWEP